METAGKYTVSGRICLKCNYFVPADDLLAHVCNPGKIGDISPTDSVFVSYDKQLLLILERMSNTLIRIATLLELR